VARMTRLFSDAKAAHPSFSGDLDAELAKYRELAARVKPYVADTVRYINDAHKAGKSILVEGANATMLDINFGTYPYVTSSSPSIGGVIAGMGLAHNKFQDVIGVAKAYTTRVGSGPYPTELFGDHAEEIRAKGGEYGTTTGRPRRCGWLDMVALNYALEINGFTAINLTKLDVLSGEKEIKLGVAYKDPATGETIDFMPADAEYLETLETVYETFPGWDEDISAITEYDQLPANAKRYIARVEELMGGVQCKYIGVGPGRAAMVVKPVSASVSTDSAAAGLYAGTTDAADPIEQFCASEPDADECRVYED
jgi:adenylosuccinate synthase